MSGETDLDRLISSMEPFLAEGIYVFVSVAQEFDVSGLVPIMMFQEAEGKTLILLRDFAEKAGLNGIYPCRMITLNIHSSLEAVGFLARITTRLAEAGISVNPVSAFYHDHLFVPEAKAGEAMGILRAMTGG